MGVFVALLRHGREGVAVVPVGQTAARIREGAARVRQGERADGTALIVAVDDHGLTAAGRRALPHAASGPGNRTPPGCWNPVRRLGSGARRLRRRRGTGRQHAAGEGHGSGGVRPNGPSSVPARTGTVVPLWLWRTGAALERAAPVRRGSGGAGQAQGEPTTQLVSSFQDVALSQALEPPLLARYTV